MIDISGAAIFIRVAWEILKCEFLLFAIVGIGAVVVAMAERTLAGVGRIRSAMGSAPKEDEDGYSTWD